MQSTFRAAMSKLATLEQIRLALIDCSEIILVPGALSFKGPSLPADKTMNDIETAVRRVFSFLVA